VDLIECLIMRQSRYGIDGHNYVYRMNAGMILQMQWGYMADERMRRKQDNNPNRENLGHKEDKVREEK
jgi:hypothetical protein